MRDKFDLLGKYATAKTGCLPATVHGEGIVMAYCDAPQVCIQREDGTKFWWRADLCEFREVSLSDRLEQRIASLQKVMEDAPQAATIYYNGRIDAYEEVLRLLDSEGG